MSGQAWRYVALPWAMPLPCQGCAAQPATVALYEGRVWRETRCAACAEGHRAVHGEQLELFREERDDG